MLKDPSSWLAFFTLAALEVVLGIDNVILLTILVARLPVRRQAVARVVGLGFAMLTRIALLLSIVWLTQLTAPWLRFGSWALSGRDAILLMGGLFLLGMSVSEIRATLAEPRTERPRRVFAHLALIVVQIALLDVVFSLDSVFTAVGLARPDQLPLMIAAIVTAVVAMMFISASIGSFIERNPTLKVLALAFLFLVGAVLIAEAFHVEVPRGYLYVVLVCATTVEALNIRRRRRRAARGK
jgi:predicted tellurium resistance membrane protein TerC